MAPAASIDTVSPEEAEAILQMMATSAENNPFAAVMKSIVTRAQSPAVAELPIPDANSGVWRAERRYRALIEQIPVVTFMAAMDESIHELYVSPQIETLLGFSQKEWLENPFLWYNQLHPDDRETWQKEFARTCTIGVDFKSDYRFIARDGRVVWVHGECRLIRDDAGQPLFLQGVAYDITENKRAQESLQRMHHDLEIMVRQRTAELAKANELLRAEIIEREQAQQVLARQTTELARSNAELAQFAYVASHDLQEPLRMMASFAQLLSQRYATKLDSDAREFIHFITDGAGRMQRLINDLLLYSRVGKGDIARTDVNCNAVVEIVRENLQIVMRETGAIVSADALPVVPANEGQLVQLLQNLVSNAIKFTRPDVGPQVQIGAKRQDNQWLFWVRDNGIGFESRHAERIFVIFQRLHSRAEYAGTGIGLAVCRKIVERHGGRIWAESLHGSGSTFYFTLPATTGDK